MAPQTKCRNKTPQRTAYPSKILPPSVPPTFLEGIYKRDGQYRRTGNISTYLKNGVDLNLNPIGARDTGVYLLRRDNLPY